MPIRANNITPLTPDIYKTLGVIQNKYKTDYLRFFNTLLDEYRGTKATKEIKLLSDTVSIINSVIKQIDNLLVTSDFELAKKLSGKILDLVDEVDDNFEFFHKGENLSAAMRDRVEKAEKKSNLQADQIAKTSKVIKGRLKATIENPSLVSRMAEGVKTGMSGTGSLLDMFGPFSGILKGASGAVGGYVSKKREDRQKLGERAFINSVMTNEEKTPEAMQNMYDYLFSSGRAPIKTTLGQGYRTTIQDQQKNGWMGDSSTNKRSNDMRQQNTVAAMSNFFSGPAYKTKWTSELLEALKDKNKENKDKKFGFDNSLNFGKIPWASLFKAVIPYIIPALGIAAASALSIAMAKTLGRDFQNYGNMTPEQKKNSLTTALLNTQAGAIDPTMIPGIVDNLTKAEEAQKHIDKIQGNIETRKFENQTGIKETVPVSSKEGILIEMQKKQSDDMMKQLKDLNDNLKQKTTTTPQSGDNRDVHDIRHPLLSSMNSGMVDIG